MAIAVQNLVDAACLIARVDGLKKDYIADLLLPNVLRWVAQRAAADPNRRASVTTQFTLALVNGQVTLPDTVLVDFMPTASVADPADATMAKKMRWIANWAEFIRPLDNTLGYFTVTGGGLIFRMTRPGSSYVPGAGMTGNVELSVPARPAINAGIITAAKEIELEALTHLAAALKGGWEAVLAVEVPK